MDWSLQGSVALERYNTQTFDRGLRTGKELWRWVSATPNVGPMIGLYTSQRQKFQRFQIGDVA
jgi:hypothetical protein